MSEINLLHTDSADSSGVNNGLAATLLARLLLLLVILAIVFYAVLYFYNWQSNRTLTSVNSQIKSLQTEAVKNKDRNELVTRQEQLTKLETLIDKHLYWSYLLPELARVTLKSAHYTNITAKSDGKLQLSVSLPSYADVEKYMQIFDLPEYNQQFSNVRIVGIDTVQKETNIETLLRLELTFNADYIKGRL
jgi:hypothetical protein